MGKRLPLSIQILNLQDIADHYNDIETALKYYYDSIISGQNKSIPEKFFSYSKEELYEERNKRIEELDKTSSLTLLASLEARFKIDYKNRGERKVKDDLSREFRKIYKQHAEHVSLINILELWKKHEPDKKKLISDFIGALNYRHWLAHGRYYDPKLGRKYDFADIYFLAIDLHNTLSLII